jgi:hypothetical protein
MARSHVKPTAAVTSAPDSGPGTRHSLVGAAEIVTGASVSVRMLPGFAIGFFQLARRFALESKEPPPFQRELPTATVIMAATALESFVGEGLESAAAYDASLDPSVEAIHGDWGLSLPERWSLLLALLRAQPFDKGREPYESLVLLVELRNVLVHRAARFRPAGHFPNKRVDSLRRKFTFSSQRNAPNLPWELCLLNPACAKWAVNTAVAIVEEHWSLTEGLDRKERMPFKWEGIA